MQSSDGSKHYCVVIGLLVPVLQQLVLLAFLTTHIEVRSTQWLFHFSLLHAMIANFMVLRTANPHQSVRLILITILHPFFL
jgi:hypothetical protein